MRLTTHDLNLSLSATEEEHEKERPKTERHNPLGDTYGQISRFPGRVVSVETAYGRIRKNPDLTIEEACLTPNKHNRSPKVRQIFRHRKLASQAPPGYVDDLRSKKASSHIAKIWKLEATTVRRHRKILNEEQQQ